MKPEMTPSPQYLDLVARTKKGWKPSKLDDFIGMGNTRHGIGTRRAARDLQGIASLALASGEGAIKLLINGEPGIGKSMLMSWLRRLLKCEQDYMFTKVSGTKLNMEALDGLEADFAMPCVFPGYRIVQVEEAEHIPNTAQIRSLTTIDDLPDRVAFICTSNCPLHQFEARFRSRFQCIQIIPPEPHEVEAFLCRYVDEETARGIIASNAVNIREALLDAKTAMAAMQGQEMEDQAEAA